MQKTRDEKIMRMLAKLNAVTRRQPYTSPSDTPPPQHHGHGAGRLLGYLADNGEMNQNQLANALDIRPQSLSEMLVKLESDGLILRTQSQSDKRKIIVSLTPPGKSRVSEYRERHRQEAEAFLTGLSDEEKDTLYDILKKLVEYHKSLENQCENPAEKQ